MEEELIQYVYQAVKIALTERLGRSGYLPVEEEANDLIFGSRFIIWSNNTDVVQFAWDGKQHLFMIEVCDTLPLTIQSNWIMISMTLFNPSFERKTYLTDIIQRILDSLA